MYKKNEVFHMRLTAQDRQAIKYLASQMQRTESDALRIIVNNAAATMQAKEAGQQGTPKQAA